MKVEIVVDNHTPADKFEQLIHDYPQGQYINGRECSQVRWFRLTIDNKIRLIWFVEW